MLTPKAMLLLDYLLVLTPKAMLLLDYLLGLGTKNVTTVMLMPK